MKVGAISLLLIAITILAYAPVRHYGFVNFDDPPYIYENPVVSHGITAHGVVWAFTTGEASNYWHPLTWLSHMLDVQLFGLNAEPQHIINVGFHVANTLLVFWFFVSVTGAVFQSAFIAAVFALHPLHVESVAWISERKDVLSTFLGMLTLFAYASYVRRRELMRYFTALGLFALVLMAKPMLVTLPLLLLLLDYWPLQNKLTPSRLVLEKLPFFALSGAVGIVTYILSRNGGTVFENVPLSSRLANALVAYFKYLEKTFYPADLALLYPFSRAASQWWLPAALGILAISLLAIRVRGRLPYIAVGWFWCFGTLLPVIGLVQVGRQAIADRYMYVPLIGISLIIAFGVPDALSGVRGRKFVLSAAAALTLAACFWVTRNQLPYWTNSEVLWRHSLEITSENAIAHYNLATAIENDSRFEEAMAHYLEAARIDPGLRFRPHFADAYYNVANALVKAGGPDKLEKAVRNLNEALRLKPNFPEAHNEMGICYLLQGNVDRAIAEFSEAIRLKPDYTGARDNLAVALAEKSKARNQ